MHNMYEFLFIICCSITVIMYRLSKLNLAAVAVLLYGKNSFFFFSFKKNTRFSGIEIPYNLPAQRGAGEIVGVQERGPLFR